MVLAKRKRPPKKLAPRTPVGNKKREKLARVMERAEEKWALATITAEDSIDAKHTARVAYNVSCMAVFRHDAARKKQLEIV